MEPKMPLYDMENWTVQRWYTSTRYYRVEISQDLFGNWLCRCQWGGRGNRRGNNKTIVAGTYSDALTYLKGIGKRRQQRGYSPTLPA